MPDKVIGDPEGVAALKEMAKEHRDYLKFLVTEAQTNLDHNATFTAADKKWILHLDLATGQISVKPAP